MAHEGVEGEQWLPAMPVAYIVRKAVPVARRRSVRWCLFLRDESRTEPLVRGARRKCVLYLGCDGPVSILLLTR